MNLFKTFLILPLFALAFRTYGQFEIGVKTGLNVSRPYIENNTGLENESIDPGYHIGLYTRLKFGDLYSLNPELLLQNKAKGKNTYYLSLPLLVGWQPDKNFIILFGPELSFLMKSYLRQPFTNEIFAIDNTKERFDVGLSLGARQIFFEELLVELRYIHGLMDYRTEPELVHKHRVFQISIGYRLK